jgi:hypothetical protein
MKLKATFVVVLAACMVVSHAAEEGEIDRLVALDKKCDELRAAKLKPIQDALVEKCVDEERRPRSVCALEFSTYGQGETSFGGATIHRLFEDISECVAARQGWLERDRRTTR